MVLNIHAETISSEEGSRLDVDSWAPQTVVDLGDEAGSDLAAVEILRAEPGPPPH